MHFIQFSYLKKIWHDQRYVLVVLVVFCALFEYLYAWVFFRSPISSFIESYFKFLPAEITSFLGVQAGTGFYLNQMIAFGYAHPLILISLSFLAISIPARYISGEIESKNFDIFLSKPVHRSVVPTHLFVFIIAATALQIVAIILGTLAANTQFSLGLHVSDFARIAAAGFFFYLSMAALALAIASFQNERGKALSRIIGIVVFLYFYDSITRVNDSLKSFQSFSYFKLYQPSEIIMNKTSLAQDMLICIILTGIFLALSILQFKRRDL